MKKNKYLFLSILLSTILLPKVHASCTEEEINHIKEIESEFKVTYEYDEKKHSNTIKIYNPDWNKYTIEVTSIVENLSCSKDNNLLTCTNVPYGEYSFNFTGNTKTCNDILTSTTIKVPKINEYYKDPLCEGIEEFVLCQPTYDKEIDYETFKSRIEIYKKSKESKQDKEETQSETEKDKIVNYIQENLIKIIIVSIFIILTTITVILTIRSSRKSRRFE